LKTRIMSSKAVIMTSDLDLVGLPSPLARDRRLIPTYTISEFVAFLLLIPFWLTLVLPLSITYQVACRILRLVGIIKLAPRPPMDSGVAAPATVKPRKDRKYDMVVLGCSKFLFECIIYLFLADLHFHEWEIVGQLNDWTFRGMVCKNE